METLYQVRLRNQSGQQVAVLDDWLSLHYEQRVNGVGQYQLGLYGTVSAVDEFELDAQLEVWRKWSGGDWYCDFGAFHRTSERALLSDGSPRFTSWGVGWNDLLARRIIAGYAGTDWTNKSGAAESVFKLFVNQQAITEYIGRPIDGLSLVGGMGRGNTITVQQAWQNLLDVLQDYAGDLAGGDFGVMAVGAAQWAFGFYPGQLGEDRTIGNAAGNAPVVFATELGNVSAMSYLDSRAGEITAVYVGGPGEGTARQVEVVTDAEAIAASPWNRREAFRNASGAQAEGDSLTEYLQQVGEAELQKAGRAEEFEVELVSTGSTVYGRDYGLGDLVTVRFGDVLRSKRITSIKVTINNQAGEQIEVGTTDA